MRVRCLGVLAVSLGLALTAWAEQVRATGTVIASDGRPVADCEVLVRSHDYDRRWTWPTARTTTDAQGIEPT